MSKNKLAGIIVACTVVIIVAIFIALGANGNNGDNDLRPANFAVSDLRIDPSEISTDEKTNISVNVINDGDLPGDYQIVFRIDNATANTTDGRLVGGETKTITWTTPLGYSPGSHSVDVNGLSGTFTVEATPNPVPLNVRIDYIAIKNVMGEDDYGEDLLYGEIQLIIAVSDGKNEPQAWYIPQETPEGLLEGYTIPDFSRRQINQRIYHVDSAGHYLKVSILAYDLDSKDNLVTAADVLELLGTLVGVPETKIFKALVSLLPVEDDLVGGCEEVWYPDEGYGIGQYRLSCLDKFADANLFIGLSIWADEEPPLPPVPSTFSDLPESQTLKYRMSPNAMAGSYKQYRRELLAGENVTGSLQLTGYYPLYTDYDYTCCFCIYDPDGNEVHGCWCEEFKSDGLYHDFSFTADRDGVYVIKVRHNSFYARELEMVISPYGWG